MHETFPLNCEIITWLCVSIQIQNSKMICLNGFSKISTEAALTDSKSDVKTVWPKIIGLYQNPKCKCELVRNKGLTLSWSIIIPFLF